jgi:hypothetical protein
MKATTRTLRMSLKDRIGLAVQIILGRQEIVEVKFPFRIASSTTHTTGGAGGGPIDATFARRGHGGCEIGSVQEDHFYALQDDDPMAWVIGEWQRGDE